MIEADDVPDLQDLQALRTSIVANMRAVQLRAYDGNPESVAVVELLVPRPGPGQVLVACRAESITAVAKPKASLSMASCSYLGAHTNEITATGHLVLSWRLAGRLPTVSGPCAVKSASTEQE